MNRTKLRYKDLRQFCFTLKKLGIRDLNLETDMFYRLLLDLRDEHCMFSELPIHDIAHVILFGVTITHEQKISNDMRTTPYF